jgi:pilus assembly protein TadC
MRSGLLLLAAALVAWPSPTDGVARMLRSLHGPRGRLPAAVPRLPLRTRRWCTAAALGLAVALLLGGPGGVAAAPVVAVLAARVLAKESGAGTAAERGVLLRDLPTASDLLAVCVSAGVTLPAALAAVAAAVPGPLGAELQAVAGARRLGADPRTAWAGAAVELGPLARTVQRAETSGARAAPALTALAAEARTSQRAATDAAVRRAGVWVLAPLGLCFLPAFVCLGIVPLVLGIAGNALG